MHCSPVRWTLTRMDNRPKVNLVSVVGQSSGSRIHASGIYAVVLHQMDTIPDLYVEVGTAYNKLPQYSNGIAANYQPLK